MPMKNPPHPGDFIRTEIIRPAGLSVTAAAASLYVSRPALSSLLNGNADLSGDMALRIEKAFGVRMDTRMRMQAAYNIAQTRKREKTIHVRRISQPANAHAHEETVAKLTIAPSCASTPLLRSIGHQ
jgi:addiction module HigA family antidote